MKSPTSLFLILFTFFTLSPIVAAEEVTVQAKGMVCESCINRITKQLKKNDSVDAVSVDLETQLVKITTKDKQTISDDAIHTSFTKADLGVIEIKR